jgi:CBS domain-containing protein/sporulation protein YlmC with PRC-barrel domain
MNEQVYFLTEIANTPVILKEKRIGKLEDFVIVDRDKFAEITHICVARPFGEALLTIPWESVVSMGDKQIVVNIESPEQYAVAFDEKALLLKDYILDKKVLDVNDREVEVVYDVKMVMRNNKLYVVDVDLSKYGFLRRIGLKGLANFIYNLAEKIQKQTVSWSYVEPIPEQISSFKGDLKLKVLKEELTEMPPVDLADILEEMGHEQRMAVFNQLEPEHASDTLEELDPNVQRDMIESLQKDKAAVLINDMTPGQAADILSVLPLWEVQEILKLLTAENAVKIKSILEAQEIKVLDFAITTYLKFTPDKTVLQARRSFQRMAKGKDVIMYLYILEANEILVGIVDLKELLIADDEALLKDIMTTKIVSLNTESSLKEASETFARYAFRALPVIDQAGKMLGVLPYRDIMNLKHLYLQA